VQTFATWGGQMFIAGGDEASQKAILDRLDGTGAPTRGQPVIDDSMAYGEVYGVLMAGAFSKLVRDQDPNMAQLIDQTAKGVTLHMDVSHDVGLVADVDPSDPKRADELRRALGSALSLARMKAQAEGKGDEADLLDLARVRATDGAGLFRVEAGLPYEYMAKAMRKCIAERKKRAAEAVSPIELPDAG
jgi:hypothetical protein